MAAISALRNRELPSGARGVQPVPSDEA